MDELTGILTIIGCIIAIWFVGFAITNANREIKQEKRSTLSGLDWAKAAIEDATNWIGGWPQRDGVAIICRNLVRALRNARLENAPIPEELQKRKLAFSKEEQPAADAVVFLWNLFAEASVRLSGDESELKGIRYLFDDSSRKFLQSGKSLDFTRVFIASTILLYCAIVGIMKKDESSSKQHEIDNRLDAFEKGFSLHNFRGDRS